MLHLTVKDFNGQEADNVTLSPHVFSTGSRGFRTNRKVEVNGKRYQCNIQFVEIGSKPKPDHPSTEE